MENMKTVVIFFILSSLFVADVLGYCYLQNSDMVNKCRASNGQEFDVGVEYVIPKECEICHCSDSPGTNATMRCCGYGIKAGAISPPRGCKVVGGGKDGCQVKIVKIRGGTPCTAASKSTASPPLLEVLTASVFTMYVMRTV